jgi:transcription elongation factor GreA
MTYHPTPAPGRPAAPDSGVVVTQAEFDQLLEELHALRSTHREELASRLREARGAGVAGDNDDRLAVMEDVVVDTVKIAQLERVIALARIIDGAPDDGAVGLGSIVRVESPDGRQAEYEFVGVRSEHSRRTQVTPSSPIGQALLGAHAGDTVDVTLPNGRGRSLKVLAVLCGHDEGVLGLGPVT